MITPSAVAAGWQRPELTALPLPPELPGLPPSPRVLLLANVDCLVRGLAAGTARGRAPDQEVRSCLSRVHATAALVDPRARARCAVSPATVRQSLDVLTTAHNNVFTIARGRQGANRALLAEIDDLIEARMITTRPGRKRPGRLPGLVILAAQDKLFASPVRQLRLLGIPCWLLAPGQLVADSLFQAACAVSFIGPRRL